MDWKRLVQFVLLGSSDLEQYAILLVRISLGAALLVDRPLFAEQAGYQKLARCTEIKGC